MTARVSVIVPVYNGARYLGEALASVAAQTLPAYEVIVVDDGSTDESLEVARAAGAVCLSQANAGPSVARNAGVAASSGELIAFLDADDRWLPGKLAAQVRALAASDAGFCICEFEHFFHGPRSTTYNYPDAGVPQPGLIPSCWLITREAWTDVGPFNPDYRQAEDVDWLSRQMRARVPRVTVAETLVQKRIHPGNLTANVGEARTYYLKALRQSARRNEEVTP
ncbi:MAG: glycosyltransferase family 2 protein [Dehalococcoidia bacterium]